MAFKIVDAEFVEENGSKLPLVDVRPRSMYADGHIPGAINIPFDEAKGKTVGADGADDAPELAEEMVQEFESAGIGKDDECVIYCKTGYHAGKTSEMLSGLGYTQIDCYKGAFDDWSSDPSRPVEK